MATTLPLWRGIARGLGAFAALCALFAAVFTAIDAWTEHVRANWPQTEAQVESCTVEDYESNGRWYYIRCRISYLLGTETIEARIDSRNVPAPERILWQSSSNATLGDLQAWVDAHPRSTTMVIHHDPVDPKSVALVTTDMPLAGPRTPGNLRLLGGIALIAIVLLVVGVVRWRPRRPM